MKDTGQNDLDDVELLVCVKCRGGAESLEDARRPGRRLYDDLAAQDWPEGVRVRAVECLSNCDHGCTAALRGEGRWSYVYGRLDAASAEMLLSGAAQYREAADGLIPWRARPEHFKRNCIARIPPAVFTDPLNDPLKDSE
ncbi:DUF1636 family protein [Paracoccaceae bacterium GXU_MW_L88]